jgi:hypothetical protein
LQVRFIKSLLANIKWKATRRAGLLLTVFSILELNPANKKESSKAFEANQAVDVVAVCQTTTMPPALKAAPKGSNAYLWILATTCSFRRRSSFFQLRVLHNEFLILRWLSSDGEP